MQEADAAAARDDTGAGGRGDVADLGSAPISMRLLVRQAVYWLGVSAMWAGLGSLLAGRLQFQHLVAPGTEGAALLRITAAGMAVAILVQPTVGAFSDQTASRWGRRMPYIVAGGLLDLVFLAGIAWSGSVLAIGTFYLLLQLSSNSAQGPYQGYLPDFVPAAQVGLASGLIGLMIIVGNATGYAVGALGIATGGYAPATLALGGLELTTVVLLAAGVREPHEAAPAAPGRSRLAIIHSTWGRDILRHHDYLWFVGSRLLVLTGYQTLLALAPFYLARSFGLDEAQAGGALILLVATVALGTLLSVIPAARASDARGRRPIIWLACLLGGAGLFVCAVSPLLPIAFVGAMVFGIAGGSFIAVDWALLSQLVPRDATARFMGLSNVATASSALIAVAVGGLVMDLVGGVARAGSGPRAALMVGVACFALGGLLLRRVREPGQARARG